MAYCIYLRKSRADADLERLGEGETLARHKKSLLELGKKLNLNITEIYQEILSGETIAARPVMQRLLTDIEEKRWQGVLVMEVERLARGDTKDQGTVAEAFKYSNTKIITPAKTYDPNNEFDEEYFEFGLFMSRREYKTINRRIQRGRLASVKEGKWIASTAPYGYIKTKILNNKGYTLVPHPEQANTVRFIFELYTVGEQQDNGTFVQLGMTLIAKRLDSLHILPLFSEKWGRATIKGILTNYTYIGKVTWQKAKETKKMVDGKVKKTRNRLKDFLIYDGMHEAIVDESVFYAAQNILAGKKISPVKSGTHLQNPLTGLIYCSKCGKLMTRLAPNPKNPYSALKCPNVYCDNISAPMYLVEEQVIIALEQWLKEYKVACEEYKEKDSLISTLEFKKKAVDKLNLKLLQLKKQLNNTYDLLEQGIYTTEIFLERSKTLSDTISSAETEISITMEEYNLSEQQKENKENIIPKVEHVVEIYRTLDNATAKNVILKTVLQRVDYLKTERNTRNNVNNANFSVKIYPNIPH